MYYCRKIHLIFIYLFLFDHSIEICGNLEVQTDASGFISKGLRNSCHPERSSEVCDDVEEQKDYYNDLIGQLFFIILSIL